MPSIRTGNYGPVMAALASTREAFVRAALGDRAADREAVSVAAALADFWAWRTLRREAELSQEEVIRAVSRAVVRVATDATPS